MARVEGVKRASLQIGAPIKSVKRWLKVGPFRKNAAATASISPESHAVVTSNQATPNKVSRDRIEKGFSREVIGQPTLPPQFLETNFDRIDR